MIGHALRRQGCAACTAVCTRISSWYEGASIPISSTELRQGGALRRYTAPAVADYIERNHLYGY